MHPKTVHIATVAITTFIPWLITLAALGATTTLSRPLFILVHYVLVVLLFGVAFSFYYKGRKGVDPFTVTIIAILCLFVYEIVYGGFLYEGSRGLLTYLDWLVPVFLIASTVYGTGKFFTKSSS